MFLATDEEALVRLTTENYGFDSLEARLMRDLLSHPDVVIALDAQRSSGASPAKLLATDPQSEPGSLPDPGPGQLAFALAGAVKPMMLAQLRRQREALHDVRFQQLNFTLPVVWPGHGTPSSLTAASLGSSGQGSDGTVCEDQEACDKLAARLNMCANLRGVTGDVYAQFLALMNVLTTVMMLLCGCVFVATVRFCILSNFPYTCIYPYQIYNTITNVGQSVFEVEKT